MGATALSAQTQATRPPTLEMRGISKTFPGTKALLESHLARGHEVWLVTASPAESVIPLSAPASGVSSTSTPTRPTTTAAASTMTTQAIATRRDVVSCSSPPRRSTR